MPRTSKIFITTDDTGNVYEFPRPLDGNNVQLWEITITMSCVEDKSGYSGTYHPPKTFYVERDTLKKLGMIGQPPPDSPNAKPPGMDEELRETLEKLLSLVGIYPQQ